MELKSSEINSQFHFFMKLIDNSKGLWSMANVETYSPISCSYHDFILDRATRKKYVKIQYFTEIREFITTQAIIKDVVTTPEKEEYVILNTGERIRLDRLVRIDEHPSPHHYNIDDFTCDC